MLRRILLYPLLVVAILVVAGVAFAFATRYPPGPAQEGYLALRRATVLAGPGPGAPAAARRS